MRCPDCSRQMVVTGESSFRCDYCSSIWNTVCDACGQKDCWDGVFMCQKARQAGTKMKKGAE